MVVFSIFFGNFAKILFGWGALPDFFLCSHAALGALCRFAQRWSAGSMVSSGGMISKIYFPRMIVPLSSVMSNLVDFFIGFVILIGMMIFYKVPLTINMLWLPLFILLALVTALGVGFWTSALMVRYRDVGYMTAFPG